MPIEQDDTLNARLEAFASDTAHPVAGFTAFSHEDIATNHFVEARDTTRNTTLASTPHVMARAASTRNDNPANLVDTLRYTRLNEMPD